MPDQEFDQYAQSYSDDIERTLGVFGKGHDFYVRNKAEILHDVFARLGTAPRDLKVLDVGCGIGLVHPLIADTVGQLHGVEVSEDSLEVARVANPNVNYQSYAGDILPYPDASFDCAYAICVMHHVPVARWAAFSREMVRVVRPGGVVVIIEHNPLNPATQWVVNTCPIDADAVLLKPWALEKLLQDAGAASTDVRHVLFTPFEGRPFRAFDRLMGWLPLGAQYVMSAHIGTAR